MPKKYLTLENIKTWAASLPPTAEVGYPCWSRGCPVASYLMSLRVVEPRVCHEFALWKSPSGHGRRVPMPSPVVLLVRKVDRIGQANNENLNRQLTAAQVLGLIAEVEQESADA